jgi:hypothetical protein
MIVQYLVKNSAEDETVGNGRLQEKLGNREAKPQETKPAEAKSSTK